MTEESGTWQGRREKVRDAYFKRLEAKAEMAALSEVTGADQPTPPETTGAALSLAVTGVAPSALGGSWSSSSATSATAMDLSETPSGPLASTMLAESTSSSSDVSTAWMASPLGFSEQNLKSSIVDPSGSLVPGLPPRVLAYLSQLATGRGEPIHEVVAQIADFFVENEDERAEGTLLDALVFYTENYA